MHPQNAEKNKDNFKQSDGATNDFLGKDTHSSSIINYKVC